MLLLSIRIPLSKGDLRLPNTPVNTVRQKTHHVMYPAIQASVEQTAILVYLNQKAEEDPWSPVTYHAKESTRGLGRCSWTIDFGSFLPPRDQAHQDRKEGASSGKMLFSIYVKSCLEHAGVLDSARYLSNYSTFRRRNQPQWSFKFPPQRLSP